jgi:pimeloyl-ACP methyl ester carboxylesterase
MNQNPTKTCYSEVNGLKMYYEIHGSGYPLVLIHGGGSTIQSSFGNIIPQLARNHQVIALELQAHGRTRDRDADLSFTQDADDVAVLLNNLKISNADFLGFSNGGQTLIEIALRHPDIVHKLVIASSFFKRSAAVPQFWESFDHASLNDMPEILREAFLNVNNNTTALLNMFNKDVQRMKNFKGWNEKQMTSIKAPTLVINANQDVGSVEHAVEMYRLIPNCQLSILPGKHGTYLGTLDSIENGKWKHPYAADLIDEFLN